MATYRQSQRNSLLYAVVIVRLLQPFMVKRTQVLSAEEFERWYQQMKEEMAQPTFCGAWIILTIWGVKPVQAGN